MNFMWMVFQSSGLENLYVEKDDDDDDDLFILIVLLGIVMLVVYNLFMVLFGIMLCNVLSISLWICLVINDSL